MACTTLVVGRKASATGRGACGRPLENFVFAHMGLTRQTFAGACVVFAVAWLLCWAVSKIPGRWSKMLVQ